MTDGPNDLPVITAQNRIRRVAERARYDRAVIHEILDAGFVAHVAFIDQGLPVVIPMAYGRSDESVFLHSARKGRFATALSGNPVSICVTLLDGLVVARSMFESSMNYRAVVAHGIATELHAEADRLEALRAIGEHNMPGRWTEVRPPFDKELKATAVFAVSLESASAKVRSGPPIDDYEERDMSVWTGIVPMVSTFGAPIADDSVPSHVPLPRSLARFEKR